MAPLSTPGCPGLIQVSEGQRLARLAATVPMGQAIVEIGSHTGLSTVWMAAATQAHVVAVDPWGDPRPDTLDDPFALVTGDAVFDLFMRNLAHEGVASKVTPLRTTSLDAARIWAQPIGLLFIDALHEYEHVRSDYLHWARHIPVGGWIAFHDWIDDPSHPYYGVKVAIDEVVIGSGEWNNVEVTEHLWTAMRISAP